MGEINRMVRGPVQGFCMRSWENNSRVETLGQRKPHVAGKMVQVLRAFTTLPDYPALVSSMLMVAYNHL